jgi:hypothetical protein
VTLPEWPWLLMAVSGALALHGGWRAVRMPGDGPRPGIVEFGVGMAGIAMLLPRVLGVHIA